MKVLELFSGTKSFKKAILKRFPDAEVISLDFEPKHSPDILTDILEWDYKSIENVDIIWASPNCKEYSQCKTIGVRDLEYADSLVKKALEIIDYHKPKYWFLENPSTGLLKTRPFMADLPFYNVDYCMYGNDCKKPTRVWTNVKNFKPKLCDKTCGKIVPYVLNGKLGYSHIGSFGDRNVTKAIKTQHNYTKVINYEEKIKVPQNLLKDFIDLI